MKEDPMDPVQLGQSGLKVSPLCLGTMNFGTQTPLDEAARMADACLQAGVFFWDTADMYGQGVSEEFVGQLLQGRRQRVVLATKVWARMGEGANDQGLSARHLHQACEASLRRLGTDWIDLYYLHLPDRAVPLEETLRAAEDLVRSGKVRYLACSNYRAWEVMELLSVARSNQWQPLVGVQPLYNLVNRDIEVELLPMARRMGLGVVTYSPLARGVLTNKYAWEASAPAGSRLERNDRRFLQAEWREESVTVAAELARIAQDHGVTAAQLALRWAMANELVTSVIMGPRTLEQLEEQLAAAKLPWSKELEAQLDRLVLPGTHTGQGWPDPAYYPVTGRVIT